MSRLRSFCHPRFANFQPRSRSRSRGRGRGRGWSRLFANVGMCAPHKVLLRLRVVMNKHNPACGRTWTLNPARQPAVTPGPSSRPTWELTIAFYYLLDFPKYCRFAGLTQSLQCTKIL